MIGSIVAVLAQTLDVVDALTMPCQSASKKRNDKKLNKSLLAEVRGRKNRGEFVNSLHVCDQSDKLCVWLYSSHHHHHENVIYIAHISSCQAIFVTFLSCVRFSFSHFFSFTQNFSS